MLNGYPPEYAYNLYKRGEKMLYIPVNISFCEAVYGVSSVNKIAVKKECARIRGVDHTLTWKIKILGKQVEYGIKQIIEYLIPASFLKDCLLYTSPSPRDRG